MYVCVCMCVCECMRVCVCVCVFVCMYEREKRRRRERKSTCIHVRAHMFATVCACVKESVRWGKKAREIFLATYSERIYREREYTDTY